MKEFVHLHLHTEYSLLDGMARIKKGKKATPLLDALKAKGMKACAITDHGNMYGVYPFVETFNSVRKKAVDKYKEQLEAEGKTKDEIKAAVKENADNLDSMKPIIGSEFYVVDNHKVFEHGETRNHLILLAKNQTGYKNLMKLSSISFIDGFYYKPRIDMQLLKEHSEGLICLSACIQGKIPQLLLNDDYEGAKKLALEFKSMFAPGDFYLELQFHGTPEQAKMPYVYRGEDKRDMPLWQRQRYINPLLKKLADEIGVKVVATNDVHYLTKEDAEVQDVMLCVNTQRKVGDPDRMRMDPHEFYLKTYDEMLLMLPEYPEALDTTVEIADKCNVTVEIRAPEGHYEIPNYVPEGDDGKPLGITAEEYLSQMSWAGLKKRYSVITKELEDRMRMELDVIIKMGFAGYYLIVWDYINWAKKHGIPIGPGRGSGVGSIVAYCVGITNVDPIRYNLLFERFLNVERISMPDFDVDICIEGRGKVIEYVSHKYHPENVTQIIAFGTMSARSSLKDVARAYDIPYADADKWSKAIPMEAGKCSFDKALGLYKNDEGKVEGASPDFIEFYETDATAHSIIDIARKLEGMPRQTSMHACGVLICPKKVVEYLPLQRKEDSITTQFDKDQVEAMGLVKMDFLGLRTLTDINLACQYAKEDYGVDIDFDKAGVDDPEVYAEIYSGDTVGIFQLESAGMCKFMQRLKPDKLEDVIAGVSLYRPGPMQFIDSYIKGKHNPESVRYVDEKLKKILDVTYGCIVYQEQVMQIAREVAGYSLGGADLLRRAMGKKKVDIMKHNKEVFINGGKPDESRAAVIPGAVTLGMKAEVANSLFDQILQFASYAFNKSHAAAYSVITYQTAYLKRYYRAQFMTAILNNRITDAKEIGKYVNYLTSVDIKVLPPDINRSKQKFATEGKAVRFGLMAIKGVGEQAVAEIVKEREQNGVYSDLEDVIRRNAGVGLNKRMVENMIKGGVFDCFGRTRSTLMSSYEQIMDIVAHDKKNSESGQLSLFDNLFGEEDESLQSFTYVNLPEYSEVEKLGYEKEVLGMYSTGHPLNSFKNALKKFGFNTSMLVAEADDDASGDVEEETVSLDENGEMRETVRYDLSLNNQRVSMGGVLTEMTKKISKKTGKNMGYGTLEDLFGTIEVVFFTDAFEKYRHLLKENSFISVTGTLSVQAEDRPKITVREVKELSADGIEEKASEPEKHGIIYLRMSPRSDVVTAVQRILARYKGDNVVRVKFRDNDVREFPQKVAITDALMFDLGMTVGQENVKVIYK